MRFSCWLDKFINTQITYKLLIFNSTLNTQRYQYDMTVNILPALFSVCRCKLCCRSTSTIKFPNAMYKRTYFEQNMSP